MISHRRRFIVQLSLNKLSRSTSVELDQRVIRKQFGFVHHLEITCQIEIPKGAMISATDISVLPTEFEAFVNAWRVDKLEKKRLKEMGVKYLETFVPEEERG